jgi:hypothetical protein
VEVPSVSPIEGTVLYRFHWNNLSAGEAFVDGPTESLSSMLPAARKRKHEVWACYVQAWNGLAFSQPRQDTAGVEILNTPPVLLASVLPTRQSNSANLICTIVAQDDDGDDVHVDFDWYLRREGESVFALFRDGTFINEHISQINNTTTQPGDQWYVNVTPYDGEDFGKPVASTIAEILQGGVEPSTLSIFLSSTSITLGQSRRMATSFRSRRAAQM